MNVEPLPVSAVRARAECVLCACAVEEQPAFRSLTGIIKIRAAGAVVGARAGEWQIDAGALHYLALDSR